MPLRRNRMAAVILAALIIPPCLVPHAPAKAADAALIAAAKREGSITWYTTQTINQLVRPLAEAFEKAYGIKLNYIRANSTEVALRVANEAAAGRLQADVVDGTSTAPLLKRQALVAKFIPALAEAFPREVRDEEGFWVAPTISSSPRA